MCILLFCFQPLRSSTATASPIAFLTLCPDASDNSASPGVTAPHTWIVLCSPYLPAFPHQVFWVSKAEGPPWLVFSISPFPLHLGFTKPLNVIHLLSVFLSFSLIKGSLFSSLQELPGFTLSLLTKTVSTPLFSLSLKGAPPAPPPAPSHVSKSPQFCIKRVLHFIAAYLQNYISCLF